MPARAEGEVRTTGPLGDETVSVIDFFFFFFCFLGRVGVGGDGRGGGGAEGGVRFPAFGLPEVGGGEVFGDFGCDAGGGEEGVGGGDRVGGSLDGHRGRDFAHDGVDGGVQAEGFLYDLCVHGEELQVVVCEGRPVQDAGLFFVELGEDVRAGGEVEEDPG